MAEFVLPDVPITQLLVRTRDAIQVYDGPVKQNEATGAVKLNSSALFSDIRNLRICPLYSPNGSTVCYVFENRSIGLYDTTTGVEVVTIAVSDAEYVEYSPLGTFLVTWSRPSKGSATATSTETGNMKVWDASSGNLVTSFSQKIYKTQVIQWTASEEYCFRLVSNEVQIYRGNELSGAPIDKVYHKGFTQFHVTGTVLPYVSVAVFNPEAGGKPARVALYRFTPPVSTAAGDTAGYVTYLLHLRSAYFELTLYISCPNYLFLVMLQRHQGDYWCNRTSLLAHYICSVGVQVDVEQHGQRAAGVRAQRH